MDAVRKHVADEAAAEWVETRISQASSVHEDVYMEIGMQAGWLLAARLYFDCREE